MLSLWGLLAALVGNSVIGLGNCLQKYALTRGIASNTLPSLTTASTEEEKENTPILDLTDGLPSGKSTTSLSSSLLERQHASTTSLVNHDDNVDLEPPMSASTTALNPNSSTITVTTTTSKPTKEYSRLRDRTWFLGISLVYLGELCGNWVALALIPASVVTPLGILGVVVNAVLAYFILGENISFHQKIGYFWILSGVLATILFSANNQQDIDEHLTGAQIVDYMLQFRVLCWLIGIFLAEFAMIMILRQRSRKKESSLVLYVLMTAAFGSLTVIASKFLALLLTCWLFVSPDVSFPAIPDDYDGIDDLDTLVYRDAQYRSNMRLVFGDDVSTVAIVFALTALLISLIIGIGGQEICKQIALSKYRLTQFQPMFYASHVTLVALSGMIVFQEIGAWWSMVGFSIGILAIIRGAAYLLDGEKTGLWRWIRRGKSDNRGGGGGLGTKGKRGD
ncbi:hypothetical protein G9A89_003328 [Geosiphon pyriformis]|nr:hypothetical protein G9A89_003328 [Geosiphon pyriformis]